MTAKTRKSAYERTTERVLTLLDEGTVPWHKPWGSRSAGTAPRNPITGTVYRGFNAMATALAGFESPYWVTFNQARKAGGSVLKGEHGTAIVYFDKGMREDKKTGETKGFAFWKCYTVFNVAQCEGLPFETPTDDRPGFERIEAAESIAARYLKHGPTIEFGGSRAYYRPSADHVGMPRPEAFEGPAEYYSTLFHELVHSTGHRTRLDREGVTNPVSFGSHDYSREELIAEMGACFLRSDAGIECPKTLDNSAAYIDSWRRKLSKDSTLIIKAASAAQKAADRIIGERSESIAA